MSKGQEQGRSLGADYQEVRFEELIANPRQTLLRLGQFIEHDLDTSGFSAQELAPSASLILLFSGESEENFNPLARWKSKMSSDQIAAFEELVGDFLMKLGYGLLSKAETSRVFVRHACGRPT